VAQNGGNITLNFSQYGIFNGGNINFDFVIGISDPPIVPPDLTLNRNYTCVTDKVIQADKSTSLVVEGSLNHASTEVKVTWGEYSYLDADKTIAISNQDSYDSDVNLPWANPDPIDHSVRLVWALPHREEVEYTLAWDKFSQADGETTLVWGGIEGIDFSVRSSISKFTQPFDPSKSFGISHFDNFDTQKDIVWGEVTYSLTCTQVYTPPDGNLIHLNFSADNISSLDFKFNDQDNPLVCTIPDDSGPREYPSNWPPYDPQPSDVPTNEILQVYFIMHSVQVVVLPARTPIQVSSLSLSLDIDSFAWSLSATVLESISLIRPGATGVKEIEVTVDGYVWVFIVESYNENKVFGKTTWTVSGRSKTAYLSAPYILPASDTYTTQLLASQIVTDQLVGTGFTLGYSTVDWLVPADSFSYENSTPMQVVKKVADAVGGVILPHKSSDSFTLKARYLNSPWDWATSTPVASLTSHIILGLSGNWQPKGDINGVYVGGSAKGVQCFVKRVGTAGELLAPQVVDNLISTADVGRERGRNILSNTGNQEVMSLQIPLLPLGQTPGVYDCGDLLEIDEGAAGVWKGLVLGVGLSVSVSSSGLVKVDQTVSLERHH